MNLSRVANVVQRIRIQHEQVGPFAGLDRADLWIDLRDAPGAASRRHDHLHRISKKFSRLFLTVHGTKDRSSPYGGGREWALMLPNARLLTIENVAHAPW